MHIRLQILPHLHIYAHYLISHSVSKNCNSLTRTKQAEHLPRPRPLFRYPNNATPLFRDSGLQRAERLVLVEQMTCLAGQFPPVSGRTNSAARRNCLIGKLRSRSGSPVSARVSFRRFEFDRRFRPITSRRQLAEAGLSPFTFPLYVGVGKARKQSRSPTDVVMSAGV